MTKFTIGDRVGASYYDISKLQYNNKPYYGIVTAVLTEDCVFVKWDDKWRNDRPHTVNIDRLRLESELFREYSDLEQAFHSVELEVQSKLVEAGQIILEAQKIARASGFDLQELSDACSPLEDAMSEAGWQTSSWHC